MRDRRLQDAAMRLLLAAGVSETHECELRLGRELGAVRTDCLMRLARAISLSFSGAINRDWGRYGSAISDVRAIAREITRYEWPGRLAEPAANLARAAEEGTDAS
jgi:hypothetical protein